MDLIRFLSSDVKEIATEIISDYIEIDLDSENVNEELDPFYRFANKLLDAENLVILAGSGTSLTFNKKGQEAVAPSMWHLWESCRRSDPSLFDLVLAATNYNILQKEKDSNDNPKEDIELLLSLCDSSLALGNLSGQRTSQVTRFLEKAKKIILEKTNFTDSVKSSSDWVSHEKFLRSVARRNAKQQRLKLFTTNYDLAFEQTASNIGFVVIDGFEYSSPSYFNPMWFNYDIVNRSNSNKNQASFIPNVLHLYKMHGSVDWRKVNGRVRKTNVMSDYGDPVFIYPSSSKYQSSYDSPYLDMMSSFLEVIKNPKTAVICVGFGFNDKHINNAITMALRTNPEFMLMVSTKDPFSENSSFNKAIKNLLVEAIGNGDGRIAILDSTFEQFSKLLPERRSSSPEDDLFKAFEKLISNVK